MPDAGTVIGGRYRLVRRIGEGATAAIWEAEHTTLGRVVAVKFLHHVGPPQSEASQRFVRESKVVAAIKHRNVVDILDFGLTGDDHQPYMVMERLEGRTLADHAHRVGPLPVAEAARLTSLMLRGLSAVHDAGMVHRDLKPENVFLVDDEDGPFPKLLDFGLSRRVGRGDMTQEGMLLGTPDYMSPEQAQGSRNLDARSDIYSMGVILYELVTGRMPFAGDTLAELLSNVVDTAPLPVRGIRPDVPEALVEIIDRAMAKDKAARFANARDMRNALAAADLGMSISPESGLIPLSERPAQSAPRGVFGAEGAAKAPTKPSGKTPAVPLRSAPKPPAAPMPPPRRPPPPPKGPPKPPDDGATKRDVTLPEQILETNDGVFARPEGVTPAERKRASDSLAETLPQPQAVDVAALKAMPDPAPKREPTGSRMREDSVSAFTTTPEARNEKPKRSGAGTAILVVVVLLAAAGGVVGWVMFGGGASSLPELAAMLGVDAGGADGGALAVVAEDAGVADAAIELDAPVEMLDAGPADAGAPDDVGPIDAGDFDADLDAGELVDAGEDAAVEEEEATPRRGRGRPRRRRPPRRR